MDVQIRILQAILKKSVKISVYVWLQAVLMCKTYAVSGSQTNSNKNCFQENIINGVAYYSRQRLFEIRQYIDIIERR